MRKRKRNNKKYDNNFRLFGILIIVVLFILQIISANSLSSKGREINHLVEEKERLSKEFNLLKGSLAALGSLDRIKQDASKIGMIESGENFDYLLPPKVAFNQ